MVLIDGTLRAPWAGEQPAKAESRRLRGCIWGAASGLRRRLTKDGDGVRLEQQGVIFAPLLDQHTVRVGRVEFLQDPKPFAHRHGGRLC